MPAPLQITRRSLPGATVLALSGGFVLDDDAHPLKDEVAALVAAGRRHLIIDLRDVTYMDSGGAGALVEVYLHVVRRDGQLKLLRPSARASRVLQITRLLSVFEVFEDEEQAVRSFGIPAGAASTDEAGRPAESSGEITTRTLSKLPGPGVLGGPFE